MSYEMLVVPEFAKAWITVALRQHIWEQKTNWRPVPSQEEFECVAEWLRSVSSEQFDAAVMWPGLDWTGVVDVASVWRKQMADRAEPVWFSGHPDDVETVLQFPAGWRWVRVTSLDGLAFECDATGCLPPCRSHYGDKKQVVFSLRDSRNLPHCTVAWNPENRNVWDPATRPDVGSVPRRPILETYHGMIASLVKWLQPDFVNEARMFGHIFANVNNAPECLLDLRDLRPGDTVFDSVSLAQYQGAIILPERLKVWGHLNLAECPGLRFLPDGLDVGHLEIRDCVNLVSFGRGTIIRSSVNLRGCTLVRSLPHDIRVSGTIMLDPDMQHLLDGRNEHGQKECPANDPH